MKSIGLEWWILYSEIFFLTCITGYWLGDCFGKIIQAIKGSDEIINCLDAIYASMERIESELQTGKNRREV